MKNLPMVINVIVAVVGWQIVRDVGGDEAVITLIVLFVLAGIGNFAVAKLAKKKALSWSRWFVWLNLVAWLIPFFGAIVAGMTTGFASMDQKVKMKNNVLGVIGFALSVVGVVLGASAV